MKNIEDQKPGPG